MPDTGASEPVDGVPTVEERRRLIELVLERRPEIDLDQVHDVLRRLGIDIDVDTLVADLDALGFDVDDADVGSALDAAAAADHHDGEDDLVAAVRTETDRPRDRHAPMAIAAAAVLLIVLAAVVILGTGSDDDADEAGATGTGTSGTVQASSGQGGGPTETPPIAPPGPGPDPALTEPDLTFDFAEDSAVLPAPADGSSWEPITGDLTIAGGQALTTMPGEEGVLVGLTGPSPDARLQVTLPVPSEGAGLAFAIDDDASDLYAWVAAPAYSTVNLYRITGGQREVVANSGVTQVAPGLTLGVAITGTTVELLANGVVVAQVDDIMPTARWGLVALSAATPGVFDDLLVQYP